MMRLRGLSSNREEDPVGVGLLPGWRNDAGGDQERKKTPTDTERPRILYHGRDDIQPIASVG